MKRKHLALLLLLTLMNGFFAGVNVEMDQTWANILYTVSLVILQTIIWTLPDKFFKDNELPTMGE